MSRMHTHTIKLDIFRERFAELRSQSSGSSKIKCIGFNIWLGWVEQTRLAISRIIIKL